MVVGSPVDLVDGIPITGWRQRVHWVGGKEIIAPGWPT
ncbi:Uncharacterised protein [Mycobacterium tuberculosis]|nr:Uncharacterised protein [Mycobacterium tuberculosis]